MQARPRRAENRVAEELNKWFELHGFSPIQRKPVIGRTGPDYTFNELGLVIDEKSRRSVPSLLVDFPASEMTHTRGTWGRTLYLIHLRSLDLFVTTRLSFPNKLSFSTTVNEWYEHMDEWRRDNMPDGITALVLHRPGMHFKNAVFVISEDDRSKLYERISNHKP